MTIWKRALSAAGAAALLLGTGIAASATSPFTAVIHAPCVAAGQTETISVTTTSGGLLHIEVTDGTTPIPADTVLVTAAHPFDDNLSIPSGAAAGTATVKIWFFTGTGLATGSGGFTIVAANSPCPTPSGPDNITGSFLDVQQTSNSVKKTCDTGVTGNAAFSVKLAVPNQVTVTVPDTVTLPCNGAAQALPVLPVGTVVTLHEATPPTGAAAAADTTVTIAAEAPVKVIHNAKAPAAATPRPTTPVLAGTGGGSGNAGLPWPVMLIGLALFVTGVGLLRRRVA